MWQCSNCEYFNDNWDEICARCETARTAGSATAEPDQPNDLQAAEPVITASQDATIVSAAPEAADKAEAQHESTGEAAAAKPGKSLADRVLLIVIVVVGLAIVGSAVTAWQMGLLGGKANPGSTTGQTGNSVSAATAGSADAGQTIPAKYQRKLEPVVSKLVEIEDSLPGMLPTSDRDGRLSTSDVELLGKLDSLGDELFDSWELFDQFAAGTNDPDMVEVVDRLRERYTAAFMGLLDALGRFRSADLDASRREYLLSDRLIALAEQHGFADPGLLKESWLSAVYDSKQLELDLVYGEYYQQLSARIGVLEDLHRSFSATLSEDMDLNIRSGVLSAAAKSHLESLDSFAYRIEDLVHEFETYRRTLEELETSDRMQQLIDEFERLAQEDHLYCFTESYEIYVRDKQLVHPAYEVLKGHFSFVLMVWPRLEYTYSGIAAKYESDWVRMWRPDLYNKQ